MARLITTPIFYVNAQPHLGHAFTLVLSDAICRYRNLRTTDRHVLSTGTDEHGLKIEKAAAARGLSPRELCDNVSHQFRALADMLNVGYGDFVRTTEQRHSETVHELWRRLETRGAIYSGRYEGWYSVSDEAFLAEAQTAAGVDPASGAPCRISLESGHRVDWLAADSLFFRLSAYREPLLQLYASQPDFIVPAARARSIVDYVRGGLADLSISRTGVRWGLAAPGHAGHTVYVWLDALASYITACRTPTAAAAAAGMAPVWPASLQVIGKDILKFHAVYWPALLLAAELPLPRSLIAHGHWTVEGRKMSKSLGNVIEPHALAGEASVDGLRYFLLREASLAADGDYTRTQLAARVAELANAFVNLVLRCSSPSLNPSGRFCPAPRDACASAHAAARPLMDLLDSAPPAVLALYDSHDFSAGLRLVSELLREANRMLAAAEPWALRARAPECADALVYLGLETSRVAALLLQPVTPHAAARVLDFLGVRERALLQAPRLGDVCEATALGAGAPMAQAHAGLRLFPKVKA